MVLFKLVLPQGFLPGAVLTVVDVLREVNSLAQARAGRRIAAPVAWRAVDAAGRAAGSLLPCHVSAEESRAARCKPDVQVLLIPPLMMITIPGLRRLAQRNAPAMQLVRAAHAQGHWIGGCGTGLWLLARAGILDHQPAPLPWLYQSGFAHDFPAVPIASETPLVVGRQLVMASAPSLMSQLALKLLECVGLVDLAGAARDKLVVDPERQHLVTHIPEQVVGVSRDAPLHRAVAWIESNAGRPITVADIAAAAAVSERTLSRLFQRHLGRSPLQFLNELRVKRAQMWLQATWRSVHEIAQASGYTEAAAFRRMFKQVAGMTPGEYRRRFTVRTPRAIWQIQAFDEVPAR
jgi:transcriptional regulator GlxA family with amidase domain